MTENPRGSPAGIVFRRLETANDRSRAERLLPACVLTDHDGACVFYGLCDLTETETTGLAGVAVVRSLEPTTSRLCGLAMSPDYRGGRLGQRLVREVADRLRASGVEEITASPALDDRVGRLLGQVGFAVLGRCQGRLSLPL